MTSNQLTGDDYFFSTEPNLSENTGISPSQLRNSFKILKDKKSLFNIAEHLLKTISESTLIFYHS